MRNKCARGGGEGGASCRSASCIVSATTLSDVAYQAPSTSGFNNRLVGAYALNYVLRSRRAAIIARESRA